MVREYCPELADTGVVDDCWTGYDTENELQLIAVTTSPTFLPPEMDTIPVVPVAPPATPPGPLAAFPPAVAAYRAACPGLLAAVYVEDCWTGYVGEVLQVVVETASPALIPPTIETWPTVIVPPPPAAPPPGAPSTSAPVPAAPPPQSAPPAAPPAADPPLLDLRPLLALPGVVGAGRGTDYLVVTTTNPAVVPATFGGLPVRIEDLSASLSRSTSRDTTSRIVNRFSFRHAPVAPKPTN